MMMILFGSFNRPGIYHMFIQGHDGTVCNMRGQVATAINLLKMSKQVFSIAFTLYHVATLLKLTQPKL